MLKHPNITEQRIRNALPAVRGMCYLERRPVEVAAWHVPGEPAPLADALAAAYAPFRVGDPWGPPWGTTWFRIRGTVPPEWADREAVVVMRLSDDPREGFTAEGLIYHQGRPVCALNSFRDEIPVSRFAAAGQPFEFFVEAAANLCNEAGPGPGDLQTPVFQLVQAELAAPNREAFAYLYDYQVAAEAMRVLPEDHQRRAELRFALNQSLNRLDLDRPETLPAARDALAGVLARRNGQTVHRLTAIGHAHIDTAWLWPLRESIRKCARTFSTALDYMADYPEYVFGCSQAQQYAWMKHLYPEIFQGIRNRVAAGQWEPIGSMWVEMDCNLASGESLVRQILKGKQFFHNEFGYETRDAWIPDVFGYSAALPQIFRQCGIDFFVTQKISWNQTNKFPHHTFYWEGIDGTRIFTHFPPADTYNAQMDAASLMYNLRNFREHGYSDRSLYVYGYGDGGGGPTIEMLERMRRWADFDGLPQVRPGKVIDFLRETEAAAHDLPVWVGELYLELHRGTYTTQARTKRNNRKGELLLRDTEFFDAVDQLLNPARVETAANPERAVYDVVGVDRQDAHRHARALDRAWKLLLLNQFHDIIPGSSIHWVYEDAERDYANLRTLCNSVLLPSLAGLDNHIDASGFARPVRVANTLGFARDEVVALPGGALRRVQVPPCGYAVIETETEDDHPFPPVTATEEGNRIVLANGLLRIGIDGDGLLDSVEDLEHRRQVLAPGQRANLLQLHVDIPNAWDAWDIDVFYRERRQDLAEADEIILVESSPLRAAVEVTRQFGASRLVQQIVLTAGSRRIDFVTEVDWQESRKLLKVAFPVDVHAAKATYEIQYGHVERPTHFNTSWDQARFEVCAHRWADLAEAGYGVALLNDCKYGYDVHGNVLRLSLLRAPCAPDPQADRGTQHFTYSLFPHPGDCRQGRVIEEGYRLNVPLRADTIPATPGDLPAGLSLFSVDRPGVYIESVKTAEDGNGLILRLYEGHGARGPFTLSTPLPFQHAESVNLLEQDPHPVAFTSGTCTLSLKPFQIHTLRFR